MVDRQPGLSGSCLRMITVLMVGMGLGLLALSCLPLGAVRVVADRLAPDGSADSLSARLHSQLSLWLRVLGVLVLALGGLLYLVRRKASQYIGRAVDPLVSFTREVVSGLVEAVRSEDRLHLGALLVVLLWGVALRWAFLDQPMRYDEALTFTDYASQRLDLALSDYSRPNNHLFHTLLVHIAYRALGNRPWVIRLPSLVAGILLVPVSYVSLRLLYDKYVALLTAGLVASSSFLIEYSTNARGYSLLCLLFLALLALAWYLRGRDSWAAWLLFSLLSALGFYTVPVMLYPFGVVVIWLFLSIVLERPGEYRKRLVRRLLPALGLTVIWTAILYLPVVVRSGVEPIVANKYVRSQDWLGFASESMPSLATLWRVWNRDVPTVVSVALAAGCLVSVIVHRQIASHRVPVLVAVLACCVPAVLVQRVVPPVRVWLFLLPLYLGLTSAGLRYLLRPLESWSGPRAPLVFVAATLGISSWVGLDVLRTQSVYYSDETGTLRDAEQIVLFLKGELGPGDRVLAASPSEAPLIYYMGLHGLPREYVYPDWDRSRRIADPDGLRRVIVVVDTSRHDLEQLLRDQGLSGPDYAPPARVRVYEFAELYELSIVHSE